jgi:hypothetical protein
MKLRSSRRRSNIGKGRRSGSPSWTGFRTGGIPRGRSLSLVDLFALADLLGLGFPAGLVHSGIFAGRCEALCTTVWAEIGHLGTLINGLKR